MLSKGDEIKLMPTGMTTRVVNLYSNEVAVRSVKPGDNVAIRCALKQEDICKGFMICASGVRQKKLQKTRISIAKTRDFSDTTCLQR